MKTKAGTLTRFAVASLLTFCLMLTLTSAVSAVSQEAQTAMAVLKQAYPGVKEYQSGPIITRLYGRTFGSGASAVATAETFRLSHSMVLGAEASELLPISSFYGGSNVQQLMYDQQTQSYKFKLVAYSQYRDSIPVFWSEVRLLVRDEAGYPLVLASSSLHDLGEYEVNSILLLIDKNTVVANFTDPEFLNPDSTTAPEHVIYAGVEGAPSEPSLAVKFVASDGSPATEAYLYVVDVETGAMLHKVSQIHYADVTGNVSGLATQGIAAEQCEDELSEPIPYALVSFGSDSAYADVNGDYFIQNVGTGEDTVKSFLQGQWFQVINKAGDDALLTQALIPTDTANFVHNAANTEEYRAQVNAYVEANRIRDFVLNYNPAYPGLQISGFKINVNGISSPCPGNGQYRSGDTSITFCLSSDPTYANSAFSSVVWHEYGHHLLWSAGLLGAGTYYEGMSDCMIVLIADSSKIGLGLSLDCNIPRRDADNDMQYVCNIIGSSHACGQVLSGCVWSVRNELAVTNPSTYRDIISQLTINSILIPSNEGKIKPSIANDFLTLDDDDGDLSNGTPHSAEIIAGFSAHNMAPPVPHAIFVDSASGDDLSGDGSEASPFATINKGIGLAQLLDTVLVGPGTYIEVIDFPGEPIVVKSKDGPLYTTITPEGTQSIINFSGQTDERSVLEGFRIDGGLGINVNKSGCTIRNNIITGGLYGINLRPEANSITAVITNNTIVNTISHGIYARYFHLLDQCFVSNNIIAYSGGIGIYDTLSGVSDPLILSHNSVFGSTISDYGGTIVADDGSICADPQLLADYRLSFNSPCVNAGDPDSVYNDPDGSRNDMGAWPLDVGVRVPGDYATIQEAIDSAVTGEGVLIEPGSYTDNNISFNGKAITVRCSTPGEFVTLYNPGGTYFTFNNGETSTSIIEGFLFNGGSIAIKCMNASPTIRRNVFINQTSGSGLPYGSICLWGGSTNTDGNSAAVIVNNLIRDNTGTAIQDRSLDPAIIKNNIIYDNGEYGVNFNTSLHKWFEHPELSYNDVYANGTNYNNITDTGIGSISVDPTFQPISPGLNSFYMPDSLSPCVDAGDPDLVYNDPDCSRNDIGAAAYKLLVFERRELPGLPKVNGQDEVAALPDKFSLHANFPNPFNPTTKISFDLPVEADYTLKIFNIAGQLVESYSAHGEAGTHTIEWDASDNASGVYFYQLSSDKFRESKKMILIK